MNPSKRRATTKGRRGAIPSRRQPPNVFKMLGVYGGCCPACEEIAQVTTAMLLKVAAGIRPVECHASAVRGTV